MPYTQVREPLDEENGFTLCHLLRVHLLTLLRLIFTQINERLIGVGGFQQVGRNALRLCA